MPAPTIPLESLRFIGSGLNRPECVLATARGDLYAADWRGGVAQISPDGSHVLHAGKLPGGRPLRPNGIALRRTGSFLLADLGETQGGVFELFRDGRVQPFLLEVEGVALPPTNFVGEDAARPRLDHREHAQGAPLARLPPGLRGGFIVLADAKGARIVADGLGYTNEAIVSPDGVWLYVNETFGRRLSRYRSAPTVRWEQGGRDRPSAKAPSPTA